VQILVLNKSGGTLDSVYAGIAEMRVFYRAGFFPKDSSPSGIPAGEHLMVLLPADWPIGKEVLFLARVRTEQGELAVTSKVLTPRNDQKILEWHIGPKDFYPHLRVDSVSAGQSVP
jgi:hypothetical protein